MATLAPLRPEAYRHSAATEQKLISALLPWRSRLLLQQMLRWTLNGLITGVLLACVLLLLSRFFPFPTALLWAIIAIAVSLVCAAGLALYYRPSLAYSARRVDSLLAFHDRLGTAWEYRQDHSPLHTLQRRDALRRLDDHLPSSAISLRPGRARLLTLSIIMIAFVLLLALPNPVNAELQQQQAFQNRLSRQIAQLNHIRQVIDGQGTTPQQIRDQIDKILQQAESQLQQAKNATQAQQILASTQQKLNQLQDPQATNKINANSAAASTLQNTTNANVKALGKALANGDSKGLSNALQKLASQVNNMTSDQRSQLSQQISQAANAASGNPQLASSLQQLAKSVADGNSNDIADAIKAVETASASNSATQSTTNSINSASQALQTIANAIASSNSNNATATSNQVPNSLTPGQGRSPSTNQSPGQGDQGTSGQGNTGNKTGKSEQVYVPGQVGSGNSTITNNGDSGTVQPGSPVSYAQIIAQYTQMAHDAIDNSNIPPDLKNLISGYFNSLNGQK